MLRFFFWIAILGMSRLCWSSPHDQTPFYLRCTSSCTGDCLVAQKKENFPVELNLFLWDCKANCQYECMWKQEQIRQNQSAEKGAKFKPAKYFGKWPFIRILGMQEVASTAFSLGNAAPHVWFAIFRKNDIAPQGWYMRGYVLTGSFIYIFGWLCSALFHARDTPLTEKMDYFSATLMVTYALWTTLLRIFGPFARRPRAFRFVRGALALWYCSHLYYMTFVLFDYGYNVKVAIFLGSVNFFIWLFYIARIRRRYQWKMIASLVWTHASLALEIYDIPPIFGLFDSHSLWHALTIPVGYLYYCFVVDDAAFEMKRTTTKSSSMNHADWVNGISDKTV